MSISNYEDIIHLPHHTSNTRPRMPAANRAAQFSPFAALTGHDAAIMETARITGHRIELDEQAIVTLDMKLTRLAEVSARHPEITVTYFQPDAKKQGGAYVTVTGSLKKLDDFARELVLTDGRRVPMEDVLEIEGMG